jgi:hypothetical protein
MREQIDDTRNLKVKKPSVAKFDKKDTTQVLGSRYFGNPNHFSDDRGCIEVPKCLHELSLKSEKI